MDNLDTQLWTASDKDLAFEKAQAEVDEGFRLKDLQREKTLQNLAELRKLEKPENPAPKDEPKPETAKPASRLQPDFQP